MTVLSTLRHPPEEAFCRVKQKRAEVTFESIEHYDTHPAIKTEQNDMLNSFLSEERVHSTASQMRVRYMKTAYAARHWGWLHSAQSYEIKPGFHGCCVFVCLVERIGRRDDWLMSLSCIAHHAEGMELPGEILMTNIS